MAEVGAVAPSPTPAAVAPTTARGGTPTPTVEDGRAAAPQNAATAATPAAAATGAQARQAAAPQAPAPTSAGLPVTVAESDVELASLPTPASFAARVVATGAGGQIRLETALGQLLVTAGGGALPEPGAALRVAVEPGGAVRLLFASSAQTQPASVPTPALAPAPGGIPALAAGDVVPARLLPVAGSAQPAPAGQAAPALAPAAAAVTVRVLSVTAPPTTPGASAAAAPTPPTATPPLPLAATGTSEATVSGRAALGQPILNFANGLLVVDRGELPDGARVRLEVLHAAQAAAPTAPAIAGLTEALDEMLVALAAAQPALVAAIEARVPRMGPRLGSGALFLMSALQGGAVGALVGGEAQQALRALGREGALKRLAEALARHSPRLEVEPAATGSEFWRTLYLPVATPHGWQPLRVAWREQAPGDEGEDGDDDDRARFRIDFSFSKLGPVRVDGLAGTGRLDLLLVSRTALGAETRGEIETLFADSIGAMGLKGHIRFVEQPDLVAPEVRADERHASVTA